MVTVKIPIDANLARGIDRKMEEERTSRLKKEQSLREMDSIIRGDILPHVPRMLHGCYEVSGVEAGYVHPLNHFSLTLRPKLDMKDHKYAEIALGTITKLATALEKAGWRITKQPEARANEYAKDMTILLDVKRALAPSLLDRLTRRNAPIREVEVSFMFKGAHETDRCRLVEEEITVKAQYTPEHTETRLVVVCDEEE
jgi:hypothetical protein